MKRNLVDSHDIYIRRSISLLPEARTLFRDWVQTGLQNSLSLGILSEGQQNFRHQTFRHQDDSLVEVESNPAIRKSLDFRQLEEKEFRIFHIDGAFGGPTPSGALYFAFYTQVNPIPTETTHELTQSGALGTVISIKAESAIERRLQAGVVMDLNTTRSLVDWLTKQVAVLETLQGQASQKAE